VTWNQAGSGNPWGTPGAEAISDSGSLQVCTFNAGSTGPITINLNADGIALVQSWVDGSAANNGIIISDAVSTNGADFDSSESATAMSRPKLNVTYTVPVIPPNAAPVASFTYSCTDLDCDFIDTSSDSDGSIVSWAWDFGGAGSSNAQNPSYSFAVDGAYTVQLTVTDNEGATDVTSTQVTVSLPPLFTDVVANADIPGAGTVSGTYIATQTDDGVLQSIRERESGGKKQNRYSYLVHSWRANLPVYAMATVYVNAWSGGSSDDSFVFSWSSDNSTYFELFPLVSTDPGNLQSAALPEGVNGTIYIKVEDTDHTAGNRSLDTVFVDHLYIRVESGAGEPPAAPSALIAAAAGSNQIDLVWTDNATDEAGFKIERSVDNISYSQIASTGADVASYSDSAVSDSTTYWYRVSAWNASGDSSWSNTDNATTDAPPPKPQAPTALAANSSGSSSIDLSWLDNADNEQGFEIERSTDNFSFESAGSTGVDVTAFTDTGRVANTTYWYRVYAYNVSGDSPFSNTSFATTDAGPTITLTLIGYKIKGRHIIELSWDGTTSANVDIYRDGALLATVPDSGTFKDSTSNKGGRAYDYHLCEAGTANCSAVESVTF